MAEQLSLNICSSTEILLISTVGTTSIRTHSPLRFTYTNLKCSSEMCSPPHINVRMFCLR